MEKTDLELLEFQVENEISRLGEDSKIEIYYHDLDGQYLEHVVVGKQDPVFIFRPEFSDLLEDSEIRVSTLGEFNKEIKDLLVLERKLNMIEKD
ncbi:hypothetical protein [Marinilactibacillus kalidii]|uniref:hypothetical protein n=1 Tax=Marinilactibacillus kalidii TaxID=2820274 RepID=UPI001ABDBB78|nr:hypothetical protein [Marinilactibacillus kalidii]